MARSKIKGLLWLCVIVLSAAGLVVGLPSCAAHVPWSAEERLGRMADAALPRGMKACRTLDASRRKDVLDRMLSRLRDAPPGTSLSQAFPLQVSVVRDDTVNAFATLGGHVYLLTGLIEKTESPEELAGVLAHEMEHVRRRHILQGVFVGLLTAGAVQLALGGVESFAGSLARNLLNLKFSRDQEDEADRGGLARLAAAGIDTAGFARLFERLETSGHDFAMLSDHPASAGRAALARSFQVRAPRPLLAVGEDWKALRQTLCVK